MWGSLGKFLGIYREVYGKIWCGLVCFLRGGEYFKLWLYGLFSFCVGLICEFFIKVLFIFCIIFFRVVYYFVMFVIRVIICNVMFFYLILCLLVRFLLCDFILI